MTYPQDWVAPPALLADRVALITGASEGIGRCAARIFAAHGATVIAIARRIQHLETLHDEIVAAGHPQPIIQGVDLAGVTANDCRQLADAVGEACGRIDLVLHNAGLLGERVPLNDYAPETWRQVLATNLDACFLLTQACLPWLAHSSKPRVLFTTSGVGLHPRAYWGAYAVSKAGLEALMRVFADEQESLTNTAFANINPGATRTAMRARAVPGENPKLLPRPEDLMPFYLWLAGGADKADINGRTFDAHKELNLT